ncbi:hypothetical protein CNR22_21360 [Sphingobacteriaceae bacterium]|nr:hypothetical protein CNR22_21360 [Sphingobacteriaceae bacterium]
MSDYKYKIEFKNNEITLLFGEDFYGDKSTFWNAHQSMLTGLYKKVISTEFPFTITLLTGVSLKINTQKDFDTWITKNQPFTIAG